MTPRIEPPGRDLTLREMLAWSVSVLDHAGACFAQGTDNASDEAAWLVLHALGEPLDAPIAAPDRVVNSGQTAQIVALLQARVAGTPAAYLTGKTWFCGHEIVVDPRVIVPRSPIAELIGERFQPWCEPGSVKHILDLCTGSGCIAIACARAFPDAQVDACDISADALDLACVNVRAHQLERRIRVLQSDLFEALRGEQYDLIVSNPPYVPSKVVDRLPAELQAEPRLALDGGDQGMDVVAQMLHIAEQYLHKNGVLVVEVGDYKDELLHSFPDARFVWPQFVNGGSGVFVTQASDLRLISPRRGR